MKKFLVSLLVVIGIIGCISVLNTMESTYTREATVLYIKGDTVTVEDKSGFLWELKSTELQEGQRVCLTMQDNHTDSIIKDDIIVKYEII